MTDLLNASNSRKAQLKIQQMAFMLVALIVFFAMVGIIYFSISLNNISERAGILRDDEAKEIVRQIAGTPEFISTERRGCSSCVDLDKVFVLSQNTRYDDFWELDYLAVERVYPIYSEQECDSTFTYPNNCNQITLIKKTDKFGSVSSAFVSLVRWDANKENFVYEIGIIHASGENLNA